MTEEMTTIVNVDDQEAGRYARRRMLERAGYRVIDATCGADAWRVVEEVRPPLVPRALSPSRSPHSARPAVAAPGGCRPARVFLPPMMADALICIKASLQSPGYLPQALACSARSRQSGGG